IRHHRLLESYLADVLGMPWDRVHAEAEVLEHVLSEDLEELIAERLGHPTVDPHGDPIPTAELELDERHTERMDALDPGAAGWFLLVSAPAPDMWRYLAARGISRGAPSRVRDRQPFGGPVFVEFESGEHALGGRLAAAMRVVLDRPIDGGAGHADEVPGSP